MSEDTTVETAAEETAAQSAPEQPGYETFTTKASAEKEGEPAPRSIEITWHIGKDVNESIELFGAEVVHGMFKKALIVAAQANVRRMLGATKKDSTDLAFTDEQIKNFVYNEYKPGVRAAGTGGGSTKAMDKVLSIMLKLSPAERAEFIADPEAFIAKMKK